MSFFVGDCSNSRSVYRGDYSLIERDERNRLRTTALERKQLCDKETAKRRKIQEKDRQRHLNLMNSAASKIQKCFGKLKIFRMEQSKQRQEFLKIYKKMLLKDDRNAFGPNSVFLGQFLYFFNAKQIADISVLKEICRLVLHFVGDDKIGDAFTLFAGHDYSSEPIRILVNFRMKKLAYVCIRALHHDGNRFKDENLSESNASDDLEKLRKSNALDLPLLKVLILLIDLKQPWSCKMIKSLSHYRGLCLLGDIILRKKIISEKCIGSENGSCLEHLEHLRNIVNYHFGQKSCMCSNNDQIYDFTSQIFTSPSLLRVFPNMRKIFARQGMVRFLISSLPKNIPDKLVHAIHRHIGNVFETGTVPSRGPGPYVIIDLAEVATFLLAAQPSLTRSDGRDRTANAKLDQQSCSSIDNGLFLDLTHNFLTEIYNAEEPCDRKVVAVGAVSAFLYVIFNTFPRERIILELDLAYQSDFIQVLWDFIKQCREGGKLSSLSYQAPDWLLPLAVFCSVYNNMLKILDHEKFYKLEKPLSLNDIKDLITLLKQTLWHLLWVNHNSFPNSVRSLPVGTSNKRLSVEAIQQEVIKVVSELLSQLQDWNNKQQFTSPSNFHADGVNDDFISQAVKENTRENEILKQAPFLIPFTSRVKIFNSQKAVAKTSNENWITIRRNDTLVGVYEKMRHLREDDLRGKIRVTYIDRGIQEAGIDGGGLFRDFMDNTARFFTRQSQLFEETTDSLLYPNPRSEVKDLQHFHFLGTLLAKAMFDGIPVNIPFAAFFLRKFKEENNYLKDMRSFDPELYHHLIFVKFYEHEISKLGLHFVILDNEYEGGLAELCKDGKDRLVTKETVVRYIDLVANHRLNYQIPQQSSPLLSGPQQHAQKDWIDRFDEHQLQDMFEKIIVDLTAATFYWRKFKMQHNFMNELLSLDRDLYDRLINYKNYEGDISEFGLLGDEDEDELLPNIEKLRIRNENFNIYIEIRANYRLNYQIRQQSSHFLRGFQQLIQKDWTDMFNEHELQLLISGSPSIDVDNLREHTTYDTVYHSGHPVIEMFWNVLREFSEPNKGKFLKFVTGCSRGPFLGFGDLVPLFSIQRVDGNDMGRLPTAATCANTLKLPLYESKNQLESKLLDAINSDAGFDLS